MKTTTLLIVDDHTFFRRTLREFLQDQPGLRVVAEASDGRQAQQLVDRLAPQVVVMDVQMPHMDGITAAEGIKKTHPETQVILYSAFEGKLEQARRRRKADACLTKDELFENLVPAVRKAAARIDEAASE